MSLGCGYPGYLCCVVSEWALFGMFCFAVEAVRETYRTMCDGQWSEPVLERERYAPEYERRYEVFDG